MHGRMNIKCRKWKDLFDVCMLYYLTVPEIKIFSIQKLKYPTIQNDLNKLWPIHDKIVR